jgi:GTP pyrophosphokinase
MVDLQSLPQNDLKKQSDWRELFLQHLPTTSRFWKVFPDAWEIYRQNFLPQYPFGLQVAKTLLILPIDDKILTTALLADRRMESLWPESRLLSSFNQEFTDLVLSTRRLNQFRDCREEDNPEQQELLRRMLIVLAKDVRGMVVKLAFRLERLRLLSRASEDERRMIAKETLDLFSPIANRLGLFEFKWLLEDLAFRYLEPANYKYIANFLDEKREERENYMRLVIDEMRQALANAGIANFDVSGRPKHIYSIFKKMKRKNIDVSQLQDLHALRILLPGSAIAPCFQVLAVVHQLWHPLQAIEDYISSPKPNGYQSLHTIVLGPQQKVLEVQIRTEAMHQHAEFGVAAHWRYKEGLTMDQSLLSNINALRKTLESMSTADEEDISVFSAELASDNIYVLTPKNEVISLPRGATALDFAFHIHTDLGYRCRGAKVDGKIVPLNTTLVTGNTVEILNGKVDAPRPDWLNQEKGYLRTARARSKVRLWFRQQAPQQEWKKIRDWLEDLCQESKTGYKISDVIKCFSQGNSDKFFQGVHNRTISKSAIEAFLKVAPQTLLPERKFSEKKLLPQKTSKKILYVADIPNVLSKMAQCCQPQDNDALVAFVSHYRGVIIHRKDCPNVNKLTEEQRRRLLPAYWGEENQEMSQIIEVEVLAFDRYRLLADISEVFSNFQLNVLETHTKTNPVNREVNMSFIIEYKTFDLVEKALTAIRQLAQVWQADYIL